jgi:hypothetical protein
MEEKYKELLNYSNPQIVLQKARKYLDNDVNITISTRKDKKYMIAKPDGRWVHFGQMGYEDHTYHKNNIRRTNYLNRSSNIRGNWESDKYSPNNLSRNILW